MTPSTPKQSLTRKVLTIFGCIIVFESVYLLSLLGLLEDSKQRLAEERYARAVVLAIARITATMHSGSQMLIQQTLRAQTTEKHITLEEYRQLFKRMPRHVKALNDLLANEPERQPRLRELNSSIDEVLDLADKVSASALDRGTKDKKRLHLHYSVQVSDVARLIATQLDDLEKIYTELELSNRQAVAFRSDVLFNAFLVLGLLANAGIAMGLYMFFKHGLTQRLKIVADNTVNLMVGRPLLAPVGGDDEVARLDLTFREMAINLEEIRTKEAVILEHATNFICSLTTKGVFVSVPAASSAMWGYKQEELVGRRLSSVVLPEQYELTRRQLESLTQSGMSTTFENSVRCADGKIIELEWTANLNRDGTIVCIARNITERSRIHNLIKKSERRFSSIVEQLPVAVVSCDRSFTIESVNPATSSLFQYQPNELLGKRVDVLLYGPAHAHQRIEISEDLKQLMELATKEATHLNVHRRDSSQFPVELNLSTYEAPQGQRYLACFNDISTRVELELAKRDFVSMIGHDLRSPLMSLLGTLGMMASSGASDLGTAAPQSTTANTKSETKSDTNTKSETKSDTNTVSSTVSETESDTKSPPETAKVSSNIPNAASDAIIFQDAEHLVERLVNLIGDFLDLGKMEAGFDSLYVTETSLREIVSESIASMPDEKINIDCNLSQLPEQAIRADRERLTLTVAYLVEVLAFFSDEPRKVSIAVDRAPDIATIKISSKNCNLPQIVKDTCVEGYALIEIESAGKASGLRLAVCRAIVEAHSGSLSVEEQDSNAAFAIKIPMLPFN